MYCYVYLCIDSYVFMAVRCRKFHGKRGYHEILKKAQVDLSLGTIGIESSCLFPVLCFWPFMNCWARFVVLFVSGARPCHFVVVSYCCYWFSWSSSSLFLGLNFYVLSLGNWLGKRKVNGARGELCGTRKVMWD